MKTTQKTQTTAQKIKAAIKAAGIPTKAISVKTSHPGYEEVITITVKDVSIDLEDVKKIARPFESIDYDERCQEVLQGGNTFVRVSYDYAAEDEAINAIYNNLAIYAARQCVNLSDTVNINIITNNGKQFLIVADPRTLCIIDNTDPERLQRPYKCYPADNDPERTAYHIARAVFDMGGRFVDQLPAPEPTPDPADDYYIISVDNQSATGYTVERAAPTLSAAERIAQFITTYPTSSPVCYIVTRSHILARVDGNGIHAPKDRPQRTPSKILTTLDAYDLHTTKTA